MNKFPTRPYIRKLGTISENCIVETTPIVWKNELYRFEVIRKKWYISDDFAGDDTPCLRFLNVRTNASTAPFADDHTFGFPYAVGDVMYVVTGDSPAWGADKLDFYRSTDLEHWEKYAEVRLPGYQIYNMNIAAKDGLYYLLIEISAPADEAGVPFTFRFLCSRDMVNWELTPPECVFQKDRYCGSPAIYTLENDPHFYVLYLEEYPMYRFGNSIARSKDLIHWEYSPINPVLMYNDFEDKQIASLFITPEGRQRIKDALDINNSDMEICEFLGRTIIYYSWGDQKGTEFLAEAAYEGSMREFLTAFFEPRE